MRPSKQRRRAAVAKEAEEEAEREDASQEEQEGEEADDEDAADTGRQGAMRFSRATVDSQDDSTEQRRELIERSLPDLMKVADSMIKAFAEDEEIRRKPWNQKLFKTRRTYFCDLRQPFEEPAGFPFVDTENLDFMDFSGGDIQDIGYVNLATALDIVDQIQSEEEVNAREHLTQLDEFLPKLFDPFAFGDAIDHSLNIRTLLFIRTLAEEIDASRTPIKNTKFWDLLTAAFIDPEAIGKKPDYAGLWENGPFKPLGHSGDEESDRSCSARVQQIYEVWRGAPKTRGLAKLRDEFPFGSIIDELREHIFRVYESVKMGKVPGSQADQFHDAREDVDDLESVAESQPVVRAPPNEYVSSPHHSVDSSEINPSPRKRSFFTGPEALRALELRPEGPPSNQQVDDSNSAILGPRPPSVAASPAPRSASAMVRRPRASQEEEEEDFEEDTRAVDQEKSADIKRTLNDRPPPQSPSVAMGPPPRPTQRRPREGSNEGEEEREQPTPPPSSAFDALRSEKNALTSSARARDSPSSPVRTGQKQRRQWSDNDTYTLIDLVRKTHAGWSVMEKHYGDRFEIPRNQQAYRDKARNLKVDLLMTDRVLPPCFDLVALSKKETDKVVSYGKNPYRKENDLDDDDNPINTDLEE